jgi:3-methylcrotonyl-CoA carboxylase alpha subunit
VAAARAVGYVGAGTVEFIAEPTDDGRDLRFYFMEMNTRLQVEHPVTEGITGLDLVEWQLRVAAGEPLPLRQDEVTMRGHAIEARICAENPEADFLPATGTLHVYRTPAAAEFERADVRIDAGVREGDAITPYYDPMIAKLIVLGENRADAIGRMQWALGHYIVLGDVITNISFLCDVLAHHRFVAGDTTTDFVDTEFQGWQPGTGEPSDLALVAAALADMLTEPAGSAPSATLAGGDPFSPWRSTGGFRLGGS